MTGNIILGLLGGGNLILFVKFLMERHTGRRNEPRTMTPRVSTNGSSYWNATVSGHSCFC